MFNDIPVVRRNYIVSEILNHNAYKIVSLDENESFQLVLQFYSIKKPTVGDVLELPDSMLRYEENGKIVMNRMLAFGLPDKTLPLPEGFNVQEDYAFIVYAESNERIMMQRYYG